MALPGLSFSRQGKTLNSPGQRETKKDPRRFRFFEPFSSEAPGLWALRGSVWRALFPAMGRLNRYLHFSTAVAIERHAMRKAVAPVRRQRAGTAPFWMAPETKMPGCLKQPVRLKKIEAKIRLGENRFCRFCRSMAFY